MVFVLPVVILIVAVTAALAWLFGVPWYRGRRRQRQALAPFTPQWRQWLHSDVPIYRRMPAPLQQRLHGLINIFVAEKSFVGCNGIVVTERMRVIVAAYACLLVMNRPGVPVRHLYDDLLSILIYPTPFIVPQTLRDEHGLVSEERQVLSGQAWDSRRIILSWEDVEQASELTHNVVLHEFAHYLDMEDESMDGAPSLGSAAAREEWSDTFWDEFDRLRHHIDTGQPTLLDPYAATAPAEFFAVVTEVFFNQPVALAAQHPGLYTQLAKYYRHDPANWA